MTSVKSQLSCSSSSSAATNDVINGSATSLNKQQQQQQQPTYKNSRRLSFSPTRMGGVGGGGTRKRLSLGVDMMTPASTAINGGGGSSTTLDEDDNDDDDAAARFKRLRDRRVSLPASALLRRRSDSRHDGDDKELVADDSGAMMPRWKRDLMREAPSVGLLGGGARQKHAVAPAISKARRLRELEKLKDENENDVSKLIGYERERRRNSQVNMFMTMVRVKQAADSFSQIAEDVRQRSNTTSSADSTS